MSVVRRMEVMAADPLHTISEEETDKLNLSPHSGAVALAAPARDKPCGKDKLIMS